VKGSDQASNGHLHVVVCCPFVVGAGHTHLGVLSAPLLTELLMLGAILLDLLGLSIGQTVLLGQFVNFFLVLLQFLFDDGLSFKLGQSLLLCFFSAVEGALQRCVRLEIED